MPTVTKNTHPVMVRLRNTPTGRLISGAQQGLWTLPAEALRLYDALERLTLAPEPKHYGAMPPAAGDAAAGMLAAAQAGEPLPWSAGAVVEDRHSQQDADAWRHARDAAAEELYRRIMQTVPRNAITGVLQPALAELLEEFRADLDMIGPRYATFPAGSPPPELLDEPDHVRQAWQRFSQVFTRYSPLRQTWRSFRSDGNNGRPVDTLDPLGPASPLAECGNLYAIYPDWWLATNRHRRWPWPGTADCLKLGWMLNNGGHVWLPTGAQQDEAYAAARESGTMTRLSWRATPPSPAPNV